MDSPADGDLLPVEGKTVASARIGNDDKGYDYVSLLFSDGTVLRVQEEGQTGWLSCRLNGARVNFG